jgi:hypothetical protein
MRDFIARYPIENKRGCTRLCSRKKIPRICSLRSRPYSSLFTVRWQCRAYPCLQNEARTPQSHRRLELPKLGMSQSFMLALTHTGVDIVSSFGRRVVLPDAEILMAMVLEIISRASGPNRGYGAVFTSTSNSDNEPILHSQALFSRRHSGCQNEVITLNSLVSYDNLAHLVGLPADEPGAPYTGFANDVISSFQCW